MPAVARKGGGVQYDVVASSRGGTSSPSKLASKIVEQLYQKGFCLADLNVRQEQLDAALTEVRSLEGDLRFSSPPQEVVSGLLGPEGSAEICELDFSSEEPVGGPGLQLADDVLTMVAQWLAPACGVLGMEVGSRSPGLLHSAGSPSDLPPALVELECQKWLSTFSRIRLMVVLFLGPSSGSLELQPFTLDGAPPVEIFVEAGTVLILRADSLVPRLSSSGPLTALSCWLNQDHLYSMENERAVRTPVTQELEDWVSVRLSELKSNQVIGDEGQEWDPAIPKEWQRTANRNFLTGPQVAVRGLSGKLPTAYSVPAFWHGMTYGVDWGEEVPMTRWNHLDAYDTYPEGWKFNKTTCKHACFIDGTELFDNKFFGLSVVESRAMDPMQRHILETSYEALHFAGFTKRSLMRSLIGVYIGAATSEFNFMPATDSSAGTGGANSITSNRISFCLGMQGPSYTIDNHACSAHSAVSAAQMSCRFHTDRYKPNIAAIAGAVYLMIVPNTWWLASSKGWLSTQGRCFSFEASAEGYIKGEAVGNLSMSPHHDMIDGQMVVDEGKPVLCLVASTSMMHTGTAASLTSISGPQEKDLIRSAIRQASIAPADMDAVECAAEGFTLQDAVEVQVLKDMLRGEDPELPLGMASGKSGFGMMLESTGLAQLFRVIVGQRFATQVPGLHIAELNPHIDIWNEDMPLLFNTENVLNSESSSFVGCTGRSVGGTLVHCVTLGKVDEEKVAPRRKAPQGELTFWPAGGGELPDGAEPASSRPYGIIGSWSEWSKVEPMEKEAGDVYVYTVTLGLNGFEDFQLLLDCRRDQVLHPRAPNAWTGSGIEGPDSPADTEGLRWRIIGHDAAGSLALLAEPEGADGGPDGSARAEEALGLTAAKALPLKDEGAAGGSAEAVPGTKYRVHLRVSGQWRSVDWQWVSGPEPGRAAAEGDRGARYYVVGAWNAWDFTDEMELESAEGAAAGRYRLEVGPLPKLSGDFQVVRNRDWAQTFFPSAPRDYGTSDGWSEALGPSDRPAEEQCWFLDGWGGDSYEIQFERPFGGGAAKITWRRTKRQGIGVPALLG